MLTLPGVCEPCPWIRVQYKASKRVLLLSAKRDVLNLEKDILRQFPLSRTKQDQKENILCNRSGEAVRTTSKLIPHETYFVRTLRCVCYSRKLKKHAVCGGPLLQCDTCRCWQHLVCYSRRRSRSQVEHQCFQCISSGQKRLQVVEPVAKLKA